jgi:hypothetical protein
MSLQQGGCSSAISAGVNLTLFPDTFAMFKRAGMLAPDGRCKTLDAAADGYVRAGEWLMHQHAGDCCMRPASVLLLAYTVPMLS